ncbi:HD domain-containing protein [Thermogladius sp. 4427co]|uniref:HD domain-containing protein n=1 Tax=Thermogladius sp. 4427co TaxID=3450718 RepID=UPI003F7A6A72
MSSVWEQIFRLAESIRDTKLRDIVVDLLKNPVLTFADVKPLINLVDSPAAPRKHHFFTGGLGFHTLSVALLSLKIREVFENVYGIGSDPDLILAAAILHDLFKYYQYKPDIIEGGYKVRDDWFLSHDYAIVAELVKRGAPDRLIRAVAEVHGLQPFSTIEGLIVHLADSLDARIGDILQQYLLNYVKQLEREGCNPYKAVDKMIGSEGIASVFGSIFVKKEGLVEEIKKYCGGYNG